MARLIPNKVPPIPFLVLVVIIFAVLGVIIFWRNHQFDFWDRRINPPVAIPSAIFTTSSSPTENHPAPVKNEPIPEEPKEAEKCDDNRPHIRIPILMYHHVGTNPDPQSALANGLYTPTDVFEEELIIINDLKFKTLKVDDLANNLVAKKDFSNSVILTFDDGYQDFYTNVFPLLKKYQFQATLYVISDFMGQAGYITVEEAREMADSGLVEIASHTLSHANLKALDDKEVARQLTESKKNLEKMIGRTVSGFAYPFGYFRSAQMALVKKAGYLSAASTYPGVCQYSDSPFSLFRVRPGRKTGQVFSDWLVLLGQEKEN